MGFSLSQAAIFGGLIGLVVFFRPAPGAPGEAPGLRARVGAPLDWLERVTYDWRARELGRSRHPADEVVLVTIDDETLANAREDPHLSVATRPWPRELMGRLVERLTHEGAVLDLVDLAFPDLSPRGDRPGADDLAFRAQLDRSAAPVVLRFDASAAAPPPVIRPLRPYLVNLGAPGDGATRRQLLRKVLIERHPAYAVPGEGGVQIWAGVDSEEEGNQLAKRLGLSGARPVRELKASDRPFHISAVDLLVQLAEVSVPGLDPDGVTQVKWIEPPTPPLLSDQSPLGFRGVQPDPDGEVRAATLLTCYVDRRGESHLLPSEALASAMALLHTHSLRYQNGRLWIGASHSVPMEPAGRMQLVWDAPEAGTLGRGSLARTVSAWRVLRNVFDEEAGAPAHYRNEVEGRGVILTDLTPQAGPWVQTPIGAGVAPAAVTGQAVVDLLRSEGVWRAEARWDLAVTLALAFLGAFLALSFSGVVRSNLGALLYFGSLLAAVVGYALLARHLFIARHEWLAMAGPLVALGATFASTTVYALRTERQMREFVQSTLGRYVSPEVTRQIFRDTALMRPEKREVTLCFCDLEGFGQMFRALSPDAVAALLNEYLTELTTLVHQAAGQVEYMGDAAMAFFGAPVRTERHALLACRTALAVRDELREKRQAWTQRFGQPVEFRIGLYTGEVLVGDLGSKLKSKYSVIGEPVSLASRLEFANRSYGTYILAGEQTQQLAGEEYQFREVDRVALHGQPERIYELLGRRREVAKAKGPQLEAYAAALEDYRARRFQEALTAFARLAAEDPVSALYADRCRAFLRSPPPADWDGLGDLRRPRGA